MLRYIFLGISAVLGIIFCQLLIDWLQRNGVLQSGDSLASTVTTIIGGLVPPVLANSLKKEKSEESKNDLKPQQPMIETPTDAPSRVAEDFNRLKLLAHDLIASKLAGYVIVSIALLHFVAGVTDVTLEKWVKGMKGDLAHFLGNYMQSTLVVIGCALISFWAILHYLKMTKCTNWWNLMRIGLGTSRL